MKWARKSHKVSSGETNWTFLLYSIPRGSPSFCVWTLGSLFLAFLYPSLRESQPRKRQKIHKYINKMHQMVDWIISIKSAHKTSRFALDHHLQNMSLNVRLLTVSPLSTVQSSGAIGSTNTFLRFFPGGFSLCAAWVHGLFVPKR